MGLGRMDVHRRVRVYVWNECAALDMFLASYSITCYGFDESQK